MLILSYLLICSAPKINWISLPSILNYFVTGLLHTLGYPEAGLLQVTRNHVAGHLHILDYPVTSFPHPELPCGWSAAHCELPCNWSAASWVTLGSHCYPHPLWPDWGTLARHHRMFSCNITRYFFCTYYRSVHRTNINVVDRTVEK